MAFRRDEPSDDFRRQVSALRTQLGQVEHDDAIPMDAPESGSGPAASSPAHSGAGYMAPVNTTPRPERELPASNDPGTISAGMHIAGSIAAVGAVHIHGSVEGDVTSDTEVTIAEGAYADATITAPRITVAGTVSGRIFCSDLLEILPRGQVSGDVETRVIIVHDGARLNGSLNMGGSDKVEDAAAATESADEHGQ